VWLGSAIELAEKTLYGREDVSGHDFSRAVKPLKMNNSTLPTAGAQQGERKASTGLRERSARA